MDMEKINLASVCERLQAPERRLKISAFEELQKYCENPKVSTSDILAAFDECYLYLLKCYSERYESVRDKAAQTVSVFLEHLPPNDFHVSNVLSTLFERMGLDETVEESEEIRLMYAQQLHALIKRYPADNDAFVRDSLETLRHILKKSLRDAHPAVQREACAGIVTLASLSGGSSWFQKLAENLARSLYSLLNHKHSLVRISAIQALSRLAVHVDCSGDVLSRLIMEVSPLLMDSMPLVRREIGQMGCLLLMELKDRYSYFDRIIPLVLCCLKDESPENVAYIRPLWIKCGELYYEENEAELNKQAIGDIQPANYPEFVERPTIGCRGLVQRSLRLLTLITREISDWKDNVRLHALKLLYQFVFHAEAAMTAKFFEIYPDIARACRDYEYTISREAMKVSDLMGRLLSYNDWFEHAYEGLAKNAREGFLKCFFAMYKATAPAVLSDVLRVSNVINHPDFSQSLKPEFQKYVIKLAKVLLDKSDKQSKPLSTDDADLIAEINKNLYVIAVKVMALSQSADGSRGTEIEEKAEKIFKCLAKRLHISVNTLHEEYLGEALSYVQNLDAHLDGLSEPILLLNGLIDIAKFRVPYIKELQQKIKTVWQHCSSEAKIKVFAVISMVMLKWGETINRGTEESAALLSDFLKVVIQDHLTWRAGATAEAMRSLAVATLCAAAQGAPDAARLVLPEFASFIPTLLEDHAVNTRHYTIKCIENLGEVPLEVLKPIAYAVLQRLDDPSWEIRMLAATSVTKLHPKFTKEKGGAGDDAEDVDQDGERSSWDNFLKKALDVLFIHYDSPDQRLKDYIRGTIMEFANDHPHIVTDCFNRANDGTANNSKSLQELEDQLASLMHKN